MAGRPPIPTAMHVVRGNPGKRNLAARAAREPSPAVGDPGAPEYLGEEAKAVWADLAPGLVEIRVLTKADRQAFGAMCSVIAQLAKVEKAISDPEFELLVYKVTVDGSGQEHREPKANPLINVHKGLVQTLRMYAGEFGMSPSARSRVRVAPKGGNDPREAFLDGA